MGRASQTFHPVHHARDKCLQGGSGIQVCLALGLCMAGAGGPHHTLLVRLAAPAVVHGPDCIASAGGLT